jgi:dTDP-4-amino-4,6-dideoxygalactose transaminase
MFNRVEEFENQIAKFYDAPYVVATDCCTHAMELCLRYEGYNNITIPTHTYISVPFTFEKLNIKWNFEYQKWEDFYYLGNTNIIDAAVYWKQNGYIENTYMCLSFQYQKHLSLGRGGMILLDNERDAHQLKKMSYDGRLPLTPWREQNIDTIGYHYYMTPETAKLGVEKLETAVKTEPRKWLTNDWPELTQMDIFKKESNTCEVLYSAVDKKL